jgi:hypothetical protein
MPRTSQGQQYWKNEKAVKATNRNQANIHAIIVDIKDLSAGETQHANTHNFCEDNPRAHSCAFASESCTHTLFPACQSYFGILLEGPDSALGYRTGRIFVLFHTELPPL